MSAYFCLSACCLTQSQSAQVAPSFAAPTGWDGVSPCKKESGLNRDESATQPDRWGELLVGLAELEKLKTVKLIGCWSGRPVHRLTKTKAAAVNAMCRILRRQRPIKKPDQTVRLSRTGCLSSLSSLPPEMSAGSEGMLLVGASPIWEPQEGLWTQQQGRRRRNYLHSSASSGLFWMSGSAWLLCRHFIAHLSFFDCSQAISSI